MAWCKTVVSTLFYITSYTSSAPSPPYVELHVDVKQILAYDNLHIWNTADILFKTQQYCTCWDVFVNTYYLKPSSIVHVVMFLFQVWGTSELQYGHLNWPHCPGKNTFSLNNNMLNFVVDNLTIPRKWLALRSFGLSECFFL